MFASVKMILVHQLGFYNFRMISLLIIQRYHSDVNH